ncbi:hypothetical protein SO802_005589 [Lithocarpus litseifolius]|uniref:Thioredoxin domain-containing protein n=1 Tax=Lithocarpus litseifolius TaxID=425828 RepID=A0AAW2DJ93_9ROSI
MSNSVRSSEAEVLTKAQRIVLELNNDSTKRAIDGNEFVLILGYAPWCARSAELMPQFAEAATSLKELGSPLLMAKLDANRHTKAASTLGIKGFPTSKLLFVNGTSQAYTGGLSAEEIVIWPRKETGVPLIKISSVAEADEFLKKYHTFVIVLFEKFEQYLTMKSSLLKQATLMIINLDDNIVATVLIPDIKDTKHFLGIVKSEPERYTPYEGTFKMDKILQFMDYNKLPLVTKLTELNSARVYSSPVQLQVDHCDIEKIMSNVWR